MPLEWRLRRTFGAVCGQRSIMPAQKPHFPNGRYIKFPLALIKFRLCKSCSLQTLSFFIHPKVVRASQWHRDPNKNFRQIGICSTSTWILTIYPNLEALPHQWRRQGLMVGEAHLVGETNIFNVQYIIHECGLPTICRPPPGIYLPSR